MKVLNRIGRIPVQRPNWSKPVEVEYAFKTSVLTAYDGTEQREALRQNPRVSISYSAELKHAGVLRHMSDLAANPDAVFTLPTRWRAVSIAGTIGAVLTVDSVPFWATAGQPVVISDDITEEVATVSSVSGNTVTLSAAPMTQGTRLYCAELVRIPRKSSFRARTDRHWSGTAAFEVVPGSGSAPGLTIAPDQFEGADMLTVQPNWRDLPRIEFETDRRELDTGRGTTVVDNPVGYPHQILKFGYLARTATDAEALIAFFTKQRGKRGEFRAPTWGSDMAVQVTAPLGSQTLEVAGTDIFEGFNDHKINRVIFTNGQANRVESMIVNGVGNTILSMATAWTANVEPGVKVSWCLNWRFVADRLDVKWLTSEVAEIEISIRSLPDGA